MKMFRNLLSLFISLVMWTVCACQTTQETPTASAVTTAPTPSLGAYFPQIISQYGANSFYDTLMKGQLILENGCLRLKSDPNRATLLILWDLRFSTRTDEGIVSVIDASTGETFASVGDYVDVGGSAIVDILIRKFEFVSPIPDECEGPHMVVGEFIKKIDPP